MELRLESARLLREAFEHTTHPKQVFVGFDGFTDTIAKVVDQRLSTDHFLPIETIQQFGQRILHAAGKSANLELAPLETRMGGNAPLLARALLQGHHHLTFAGTIGEPGQIEPLFAEFAQACAQVFPLGPSGKTDALEFQDGKLFFGQMSSVATVDYALLTRQIPEEQLGILLDTSDLVANVNWTMIPQMNAIWKAIATNLLPDFDTKRKRWFFVDLADPAKRSAPELLEAVDLLKRFHPCFQVVLGLNLSEAQQLYRALSGIDSNGSDKETVNVLLHGIRDRTQPAHIVIHAATFAASISDHGVFFIDGPTVTPPLITTGGGDHFNAGYCHGLLFHLTPEHCLALGVASSGFYVQHAKSPSIGDLCELLTRSKW